MISYGRQSIDSSDMQAVMKVLQSDWLTQGPDIKMFEGQVAAYCGAKYAVAVSNATSALHIACIALDVCAGDMVWTVPNTFAASANCARYCGANVDFIDIDSDTYNISIDCLREKLENGISKPKIVIPVHFSGQSCQMKEIYELAQQYHFRIIEDASHALGAEYLNAKVGSCEYSDMTVFSFHPVKMITTGEGGVIVTNNAALYDKLIILRNHGITRDESYLKDPADGPWYYEQISLGFNYRMTDLQAALGSSQLKRIEMFLKRRRELANQYNILLKDLPVTLPQQYSGMLSSWHLYVIRLNFKEISLSKKEIYQEMKNKGISLNVHYIPVHLHPYYKSLGFQLGDFPESEQYYKEAFSLPIYYQLTDEEQKHVVNSLREALAKTC